MKLTSRKWLWISPLVLIGIGVVIFRADATQVTRNMLIQKLSAAYGVPSSDVEAYLRARNGGGWSENEVFQKSKEHEHAWENLGVTEDDETGVTLLFTHLGDGNCAAGSPPFRTDYVLVNNSRRTATGRMEFYDDAGNPLELQIGGELVSTVPFVLARGELRRVRSDGAGGVKTGWARIQSDHPIVVTSNFGVQSADGTVITDVGVGESRPGTEFTIFADTMGDTNTGVALANPDRTQSIDIELTLRNTAGTVLAQTRVALDPFGHYARFVTELFNNVADIDINEFEGTVVLKSATAISPASRAAGVGNGQDMLPFGGLTLRTSGAILTSVPMVEPPLPNERLTRMAFPQAADGEGAGLSISTMPILFNTTPELATGQIDFFKGDGSPNEVRLDGESTSSVPFSIPPGGVFRVETDGTGELAVGWARVSTNQSLSGVAIFTIKDSFGATLAAVGVAAAALHQQFEVLADTTGIFDTGIAIVNPFEPDADGGDKPVRVNLGLLNSQGFFDAQITLEFLPRQHQALFLTELFKEVDGINELRRRLRVTVLGDSFFSNDNFVAAMSLRAAAEKLTSVPVFQEQLAFAPSAMLTLLQSIQGTSTGFRLSVHQTERDAAIKRYEIQLPGLGLNTEGLAQGLTFGSGYLSNLARLVSLVAQDVSSQTVEFDLLLNDSNVLVRQGSGRIAAAEGQVEMSFEYLAKSNTRVGVGSDTDIWIEQAIFQIPAQLNSSSVSISLTSVPSRERAGTVRKLAQAISFSSKPATTSYVENLRPVRLTAGTTLVVAGGNFGAVPEVVFPGAAGDPIVVAAATSSEGQLEVLIPPAVGEGEIAVDNGSGPGSGPLTRMEFGPSLRLESVSDEQGQGLVIELNQEADLLGLEAFTIELFRGGSIEGVEVGQDVGTLQWGNLVEEQLLVQQLESDRLVLRVTENPDFGNRGTLTIERNENGRASWSITFEPRFPTDFVVLLERSFQARLRLNLSFLLPGAGEVVLAKLDAVSTRSGLGEESRSSDSSNLTGGSE